MKKTEHYTYRNHEPDGSWKSWYHTGKLKEKTTYKNGLKEGAYIFNDTAGRALTKGRYYHDKNQGLWEVYYPGSGKLYRRSWYRRGIADSTKYTFYENGNPETIVEPVPGTGHYDYISKSREGALQIHGWVIYDTYGNQYWDGPVTSYFPEGEMQSRIQYKMSIYDGKFESFYPTGMHKEVTTYAMGTKSGSYAAWYENGQMSAVGYYQNNQPDSVWKEWFEDGKKKSEKFYRDGQPYGLQTEWYNNGQLQRVGKYFKLQTDSIYTEWYRNGVVKDRMEFKNFKLIKHSIGDSTGVLRILSDYETQVTTRWTEQGRIISRESMDNTWDSSWYENGGKRRVDRRNPAARIFSSYEWYQNGKLHKKSTRSYDAGIIEEYSLKGNKISECEMNYILGTSNCKYWDEKGKRTNPVPELIAEPQPEEVFEYAEERARYPGGDDAFFKEVYKRLEYDMEELEYEGEIKATLTLNREGAITNVDIYSEKCPECNAALRKALQDMPHFYPAKVNGNPVIAKVDYTFTFRVPE